MFRRLLQELSGLFMSSEFDSNASHPEKLSAPPNEASKPTCFIIEDEPGIRHFLSHLVRRHDVTVKESSGADKIIESVKRESPELIFLDLALEDADAIEVMRGLATAKYSGAVQLMSGRGISLLNSVRRVGARQGLNMLPVLEKPLRIDTISEIVDRFYGTSSAPAVTVSLTECLDRDWMRVWYQPKIDLKRMRVVGMEALARVEHPDHGVLLPGSFLPQAGLEDLVRLTEHVLVTTLRDWPSLSAAGGGLVPAINDMSKAAIAPLFRQNVPNSKAWNGLIVELTESQVIDDVSLAEEIAAQLKIYDIRLAIDDFGEGYSSFSRLKQVPFHELKIDRKFVRECSFNPTNKAICEAVINLAHRLGCVVAAEGVESEADLRALHQMGCDLVQGFFFAKPLPKARFEDLLRRRQKTQITRDQSESAPVPLRASA
jgi:EAL domain-containing protein (putative c-di-GMP-specific phosphodiesterase class I)/CheY-like chemotaxis protein